MPDMHDRDANFPPSDTPFEVLLTSAEAEVALDEAARSLLFGLTQSEIPEAIEFANGLEWLKVSGISELFAVDEESSLAAIVDVMEAVCQSQPDADTYTAMKKLASFGHAVNAVAIARVHGMTGAPKYQGVQMAEAVLAGADISDIARTELQTCLEHISQTPSYRIL